MLLVAVGGVFFFISHYVQIKPTEYPLIPEVTVIFISHYVQIKLSNLTLNLTLFSHFISHYVQIKRNYVKR